MHLITFTTDFGTADWFVGSMKGVVLALSPRVRIVDLTHQIPAGDIRAGAFALAASSRFFPKNTVHVAVVDPGVGSRRKSIAVRTANYFFVGPDNGVLSFALAREKIKSIRVLKNEKLFLPKVSRTFHGRDVFAPVAARLSNALPLEEIGPCATDYVKLEWPALKRLEGCIEGEVVYIDRFGNAITNIDSALVGAMDRAEIEVIAREKQRWPLKPFYGAVAPGRPVAVFGSTGFLELAVHGGSAAELFGLRVGGRVAVRCKRKPRD